MIRKSLFGLLYLLLSFQIVQAQIPANPIGINPPGLKWRQINTDKVQVIFPAGLEDEGNRVTNIVHYLWDNHDSSVGDKEGKVSILLQNQAAISNGFVTVGPFRSEFYMTPPQFDVTSDWLDILTIHEYRHVEQFVNSRKGITNFARKTLGSWAWGGFMATALPRWYFEGDATSMETILTASGRGRFPAFNMEYRSLVLGDQYYDYEKASAGSLIDFVPNWYRLGYYLTSYARKEFGEEIWSKVIDDAVRYKGLFYPFSRSLEKHTQLTTKELYEEVRNEMDSVWKNSVALRQASLPGDIVNQQDKKTVINYNNPIIVPDGGLIVQKSGYNELPAYYYIDENGEETKLTEAGVLLDRELSTLSFADGKICWAELAFHPRWRNKTYSIIRYFDLNSKIKYKLTQQTRYYSPTYSPDGTMIAAIEISEELDYRIVILNAETGTVIQTLPNPQNTYFAHPQWTEDQASIIVIAKQNETHQLRQISIESREVIALTPALPYALSHPFVQRDTVYFSAAYGTINNIFATALNQSGIYQVTNSVLGAFQPSVSTGSNELAYSEFSSTGYNVRKQSLAFSEWKAFSPERLQPDYIYLEPLVQQEEGESILSAVPDKQYEVRKFNKWSGLINPHSILPFLNPPIIGASILSDNKFSTLSAQAGAFYNLNEEEWTLLGELSYAEFFPVINLNYRRSGRSANFYNFDQIRDTSVVATLFNEEWVEDDFSAGVNIPLNFSQGNQTNQLNVFADYHLIQTSSEGNFSDLQRWRRDTLNGPVAAISNFAALESPVLADENFQALELGLRFFSLKRLTRQHLRSRLGVVLDANYRTLLNGGPFSGDVLLLRGDLYLPGLSKNHSLLINTAYQKSRFLDNYKFSNRFFYPRGHDVSESDEIFKVGLNYALPLLYPDWALGGLAFLKRIKANFFFDYANLNTGFPFGPESILNKDIGSAGIELTFDVRALRLVEIDFGVRYSYLVKTLQEGQQRNQFDFLLISITE